MDIAVSLLFITAFLVVVVLSLITLSRAKSSEEELQTYKQAFEKNKENIEQNANKIIADMQKEADNTITAIQEDARLKIEKAETLAQQTQSKNLKLEKENKNLKEQITNIKENVSAEYKKLCESNLSSIPWLAGMMGDFLTVEIDKIAQELDWGYDQRRMKKVATIREIRDEAKRITAAGKEAIYQLEYIKQLFPNIEDYFETDYNEIFIEQSIEDFDPVRHYLSKDEWDRLSTVEKNQLALDRYVASRKTKWQIGRDYELAVAYEYTKKGWDVDTFGSYMQLEDHGRDLIAKKDSRILIIQCKYWSQSKVIHEKHIYQLYGSVLSYCMENKINIDTVSGVFVTNILLTPFAEKAAKYLGISVAQNHPFKEFPRIKCNVGRDEFGYKTHIYHLPMDAQYDKVKICNKGEFYAFTVDEAERAGFRRTYKWRGQ